MANTAFANVAASQTDNALVAAVSGRAIRVKSLVILAGATATDVTFNSKHGSDAGVAVSPLFAAGVRTPVVLQHEPLGWFQTKAGEALTVTTGAGSAVGIDVVFDLL
jgi:hypothetical protein